MEHRRISRSETKAGTQADELLASRYSRLLEWATALARGDSSKGEEVVQEFCLYCALTKPDFSNIANLDGYLYTCLRNIYLSSLARSSREALHLVSIAEFDSLELALAAKPSGDPLQRQNDLRRICTFVVWRRNSSKSASYFILHFFHGYARREISEVARLPTSAIYNKLKVARSEVKSHLADPGTLRLVNRSLPPEPSLSWGLLTPGELFSELRQTILRARDSDCLREEELLAHYTGVAPSPIPCQLLAHIVSCEPCLAILDRYLRRPTLRDREPLDSLGFSAEKTDSTISSGGTGRQAMMRLVRERWKQVYDHRPNTLSIAVNGKIVASHDVQAAHSKLSARNDRPESVQFVEVFTEQDVRLALLSIEDLPPHGPYIHTQRIALSEDRWLELILTFDGQGLQSEVAYFDAAVTGESEEAAPGEYLGAFESTPLGSPQAYGKLSPARRKLKELLRGSFLSNSAVAWAVLLLVLFSVGGYFFFRHVNARLDARTVLNESINIESAGLQGNTEHQVLRIEEVSTSGLIVQRGTVDLWKDGDGGRYMRRIYDGKHRLIAVKWRNKQGEGGYHRKMKGALGASDASQLLAADLGQDLSPRAFGVLAGNSPQIRTIDGGFELTGEPSMDRSRLISATLTLDRHLLPIREVLLIRADSGERKLQLVRSNYQLQPSASVSDSVFDPQVELSGSAARGRENSRPDPLETTGDKVRQTELQIAVLYCLNRLGADTGVPIEVRRTAGGRVLISGAVSDNALKQRIVSELRGLTAHELLDLNISSSTTPAQVPAKSPRSSGNASVYDISQAKADADPTLRKYLGASGISEKELDLTTETFSRDALQHAQQALQHAYALDRLGDALSNAGLTTINRPSQRQWTEMAYDHASQLELQLRSLQSQLSSISPSGESNSSASGGATDIETPAQFKQAADQLLLQVQDLNQEIGRIFALDASGKSQLGHNALITAMRAIPLHSSETVTSFVKTLKVSEDRAPVDQKTDRDRKEIPPEPR